MSKFTVKRFQHFEGREAVAFERPKRNLSNFTEEELETVRDLFQTYIDIFNMIPMPTVDGEVTFDIDSSHTQFYIQSYRNIGINIESRGDLSGVYDTIMSDIEKRLNPFGFYVFANDFEDGFVDKISIAVMKMDEDDSKNLKHITNR